MTQTENPDTPPLQLFDKEWEEYKQVVFKDVNYPEETMECFRNIFYSGVIAFWSALSKVPKELSDEQQDAWVQKHVAGDVLKYQKDTLVKYVSLKG